MVGSMMPQFSDKPLRFARKIYYLVKVIISDLVGNVGN